MPGRTIAERYDLEQPLGGGAMAAVWLAQDRELGRRVAVKLVAPDADRARFEREARAVAALSHPNICQLFDYGEADQGPYMVLEYLPGGTLEDRLASGRPLPDRETGRIAQEVAAGLAHAHGRGLVHRDLKPANILFDGEGRAKIADFGLARIAGAQSLTEAGTIMGTAAYISPEQASGAEATPASDVYSFGAILYRMLTGRPPFVSDSAPELVRMHREEEAPAVALHRGDAAPPALAAVAAAALAKNPAARPADGDALLADLVGSDDATTLLATAPPTALVGSATAAAPETRVLPPPRPGRAPQRRSIVVPLAIAAVALLGIGGAAAAYVLGGGGGGGTASTPVSLSLPTASTERTGAQTTAVVTTAQATSAAGTTQEATTAAATAGETTATTSTTAATTTSGTTATTAATTTATTILATTTAATTTAATTTTSAASTAAAATTAVG